MWHPYAQGLLHCNCAGLVSIIICRLVSNQLCRDCVIMGLVSGSRAIIENPGQSSCTEYGRTDNYRVRSSLLHFTVHSFFPRRVASWNPCTEHIASTGCQVRPATTANIQPTTSPHTYSNSIPLHSLRSPPRSSPADFVKALDSASEKSTRQSSLSSAHSNQFEIFIDSGDLAEQLADVGDSLQIRPRRSGHGILNQTAPQPGHVHSPHLSSWNLRAVIDKASIKIPFPPPRHISRLERLLSAMMSSRNRQTSQLHGLVGKPLL